MRAYRATFEPGTSVVDMDREARKRAREMGLIPKSVRSIGSHYLQDGTEIVMVVLNCDEHEKPERLPAFWGPQIHRPAKRRKSGVGADSL